MKKVIALIMIGFFGTATAGGTVQRVCHTVKGKQVCKNIKVHKKFEGTTVPEAPAKKKK